MLVMPGVTPGVTAVGVIHEGIQVLSLRWKFHQTRCGFTCCV